MTLLLVNHGRLKGVHDLMSRSIIRTEHIDKPGHEVAIALLFLVLGIGSHFVNRYISKCFGLLNRVMWETFKVKICPRNLGLLIRV